MRLLGICVSFLLCFLVLSLDASAEQVGTPEQTCIRITESSIIIENKYYLCEISSSNGLKWVRIFNKQTKTDYLFKDGSSPLFVLQGKKLSLDSMDFTLKDTRLSENENTKIAKLVLISTTSQLEAILRIDVNDTSKMLLSLKLKNISNSTIKFQIIFPVLSRLNIGGDLALNSYFYPWRSGIVGSIDCDFINEYGNLAWMQVMSIFNPVTKTGIYTYPVDKTGGFKGLLFRKFSPASETLIRHAEIVLPLEMPKRDIFDFEEGVGLAYYYPEREIQPNAEYVLPETILSIYQGDWKEALQDYSAWAHTWYKHVDTPQWFKNCFNFIIGHPPGFYSETDGKYIAGENLKGSEHILQWAMWDDYPPQYDGRPPFTIDRYQFGDFEYNKHRGGLKTFGEEIEKIQRNNTRFTVYIDHRFCYAGTKIGKAKGKDWATMDRPGNYTSLGIYGPPESGWTECFFEPNAWADYIANTCGRIIKETGMDGIYLDELSLTFPCYNPGHTHYQKDRFPVSYELMAQHITNVRNVMIKEKADAILMTEHAGSDYFSQFFDVSWSQTFYQAGFPFAEKYYDSNSLNYFRFCFPEFKLAEWGESDEQVRRCFFNGIGRCGGLGKAGGVLRENGDAFSSLNPDPLIETKLKYILANKFPTSTKTVYTIYNKSNNPVNQEMLELESKPGYHYVELLNDTQIIPRQTNDKDILSFEIKANEVVCVGQLPEIIQVEQEGNRLKISLKQSIVNPTLVVFLDDDTSHAGSGDGKKLELREGRTHLDVIQTFGHKGKVILKLLQGEILIDEMVTYLK